MSILLCPYKSDQLLQVLLLLLNLMKFSLSLLSFPCFSVFSVSLFLFPLRTSIDLEDTFFFYLKKKKIQIKSNQKTKNNTLKIYAMPTHIHIYLSQTNKQSNKN